MEDLFKIEATPIIDGSFACHATKTGNAEPTDGGRKTPICEPTRLGRGCGLGWILCKGATREGEEGGGGECEKGKVEGGGDAQGGEEEGRADGNESCDGPHPMEKSHDTAAIALFQKDALGVGGGIGKVRYGTRQEEENAEDEGRGSQPEEYEEGGIEKACEDKRRAATKVFDGEAIGEDGEKLACGQEEEQGAELGLVEVEIRFDIRNARTPCGEHGPLDKEGTTHCDAGSEERRDVWQEITRQQKRTRQGGHSDLLRRVDHR